MILTYSECMEKYRNPYQLNKAVEDGHIYKIEEGIYSENKYVSDTEILSKKYPKAVFTGDYAFYVHGLTDVIPERYSMATDQKAAPISDDRVQQVYMRKDLINLGVIEREVGGGRIKIYDKERMLIELLRNKNKLPYDFYKEIIYGYREIIGTLEIWRIQEYANIFPKKKMIKKALDEEVM